MSAADHISKVRRAIVLATGIAVAVFMLSVNTVTTAHEPVITPATQDVNEPGHKVEDIFSLDATAIHTVTQINLVHELHVIWEVFLPEDPVEFFEDHLPRLSDRLVRILFERIISPNAP